jgi:hypothetical protein
MEDRRKSERHSKKAQIRPCSQPLPYAHGGGAALVVVTAAVAAAAAVVVVVIIRAVVVGAVVVVVVLMFFCGDEGGSGPGHRNMAWGVQRVRRRPQATRPQGGLALKLLFQGWPARRACKGWAWQALVIL